MENVQIENYESKLALAGLDPQQQLLELEAEVQKFLQEKDAFHPQAYLAYAYDEKVLNTVMNEVHLPNGEDEEKMQEAILLRGKGELLARRIREVQGQLAVFTLPGYEQSEQNDAFYRLHRQPPGVPDLDYDRMVGNQLQLQSECVDSLCLKFCERFRAAIAEGADFMETAQKELQRLRKLLDPLSRESDGEFTMHLKKLICMESVHLPSNEKEFHRSFLKFLNDPQQQHRWCPNVLRQSTQNIEKDQLPLCPLFGRALIRYEGWLNELVYNRISLHDHPDHAYGQLFEQAMEEGTGLGNAVINKIIIARGNDDLSDDEYDQFIEGELQKIKVKSDLLKVIDYYHYLPDWETVKCFFVNNCRESKDLEFHRQELRTAVEVDLVYRFLEHELTWIGKEVKADEESLLSAWRHDSLVFAYMVPTEHLMAESATAYEKAIRDWHNRKPVSFILEELEADTDKVYEEAEDHLFDLFGQLPYKELMSYALNMLHEISLLEFKASTRGGSVHKNFGRLKQLLKLEVKHLMALHCSGLPKGQLPEKLAAQVNVELQVNRIIHLLNKRVHFLVDTSMTELLVKVLLSKDMRQFKFQIAVGCKTNELKYILEKMKVFNPNITWKSVAGIFISRTGTTLDADAIGHASYDLMNTRHAIDIIFKVEE